MSRGIIANGAELQLQKGTQASGIRSADVVLCPNVANKVEFPLKKCGLRGIGLLVPIFIR